MKFLNKHVELIFDLALIAGTIVAISGMVNGR